MLFAATAVIHLVAQWTDPDRDGSPAAGATQWLLLPALAAAFAVETGAAVNCSAGSGARLLAQSLIMLGVLRRPRQQPRGPVAR